MPDPSTSFTSPSLLLRVRGEQPDAWTRLAELYTPLVYSWCRQLGADADVASDVTQEVFATVFQKLDKFRKEKATDSFRGWLWTVTRNKVKDHFRKQADKPVAKGGTDARLLLQELPENEPDSTLHAIKPERSLLAKALDCVRAEFEPKTWQAFWLTKIQELPTVEVASELGMSTGAVRKARFRVLHRLRKELGDLVGII